MPNVITQIHQFQSRWKQVHEDVVNKRDTLNSQINDYQQQGQEITSMFEWIRHTDITLNARLRDGIYANDVPSENDVKQREKQSRDDQIFNECFSFRF